MDHRTRQCYIDAGFGERFVLASPDADLINDKLFEEQVMPGTVKVALNSVHRIDRGAKGEWITYHYTLFGKTQFGQDRNRPKFEGMWKKPVFCISVDEKTGQHQIVDKVERFEEVWEIKYSPEAVKKILALDELNSNVGMSIQKGEYGRIYQITNVDDFINKPMSELHPKES